MGGLYERLNMEWKTGDFFATDKNGEGLTHGDIIVYNRNLYIVKDAEYYFDWGQTNIVLRCVDFQGQEYHFPDFSVELIMRFRHNNV
jgi:hypothetical protein